MARPRREEPYVRPPPVTSFLPAPPRRHRRFNVEDAESDTIEFSFGSLFPEYNGRRIPFAKQLKIFEWTADGSLLGGGAVYQSGKGGGKTIAGSAWIIWAHHVWPGLRSLIGRETYPALLTSTGDEFFRMVAQLPPGLVKAASRPGKNSLGWVEWQTGGLTLLVSLHDTANWASANLGAVWIDEAQQAYQKTVEDLMTRVRQEEGPRVVLITKNPSGKDWLWKLCSPESKVRLPNWRLVEAASDENPALPPDYLARLIQVYGKDTPAYMRWVKGKASALEGVVFPQFDPMPESCMHIIPGFEIPDDWPKGRGLDWGLSSPTAVVWGAQAPWGDWFIYRTHSQAGWNIAMHAEVIREIDGPTPLPMTPADPQVFAKVHIDRMTGAQYSVADQFFDEGIHLYPANNDRKSGLTRLMTLISVDQARQHLVSGEDGAPGIYIFDNDWNEPLIHCLSNLLWDRPGGTPGKTGPDDCQKKDDHEYDALRYLVMDRPVVFDAVPVPSRMTAGLSSRGTYVGY